MRLSTSRVYAARKALGDSGEQQKLIRTFPRKGLRFVGNVQTSSTAEELEGFCAEPAFVEPGGPPAPALPLPDRPAIAVLPFVNMSDDPEQDYFSDGISEDLITALSRLRWFFVIARNSSFVYKGKAVNIRQLARGTRRRLCDRGQRAQGKATAFGSRRSSTTPPPAVTSGQSATTASIADVFAVQDEITEAIVASIEPQLYAAEDFHTKRATPDSMDAWGLVMRALSHFWRVTREDYIVGPGAAGESDRDRPQLRPGARRAGRQPCLSRP